jgi:hypothetical protein
MEERILTRHPMKEKKGVRISKAKYDLIRELIISLLRSGEMTFEELTALAKKKLKGKFDGSVAWYITTVKLDLEARKVIRRAAGQPQRLRLVRH